MPQVTLEQWKAFIAVIECGGYAAAAEKLGKSQSAISYAVKLEESLNVRAFKIEGRKAALTTAGQALMRRAEVLLEQARQTEALAAQYATGWSPEIRIAMDTLFPEEIMLDSIQTFAQQHPLTRVELLETVLSGTDEMLLNKEADIVIGARLPPGFLGTALLNIEFIAVASPQHPLHQIKQPLTYDDLKLHRQLVVRDSGTRGIDSGWLGAEQRLTLAHIRTSIAAACRGLGYAWYPRLKIQSHLDTGELKPLNLLTGDKRYVQLYMIYSNTPYPGKTTEFFGDLLQQQAALAIKSL